MSLIDFLSPDRDPEGRRLPIKLDAASNGEFAPILLDATSRRANQLASELATQLSRKLRRSRREFLVSVAGLPRRFSHSMRPMLRPLGGAGSSSFPPRRRSIRKWPRPSSARRNSFSMSRDIS